MFNVLTGISGDCERTTRRHFLQVGTLAGLGISLPQMLAARRATAAVNPSPTSVNCILIWTQGGTSHHDTFDPKPEAPVSIRGPYQVIDTAVPGVKFTEVVPRLAKELGRFSLLRSWNPRNGSHGTADQYVMSGHKFNPAVTHPCYGSVVSRELGFKTAMPPFVQLGGSIDRRFGGGSPGYLGQEHAAFELAADPNADKFAVRDISLPKGIDGSRLERRRRMLECLDDVQRRIEAQAALTPGRSRKEREIIPARITAAVGGSEADLVQPAAYDALDEHVKTAFNMITAPETKRAFDIDDEDPRVRDRYGRNRFGQSCLLARRLIQSGVRFVTVTDGGWDTHQKNFESLQNRLVPPVDQALPELLTDLDAMGLLSNTLVLWLTDFGRTPKINSASGRDHWSTAGFILAAGAGIPGGTVVGRTDGEGGYATADEYFTEDLAATVYTKLGIPLDTIHYTPDGRPMRLNEGRVIKQWM